MIYNSHMHTPCILIYNSSQFCCKSIPGTLLHTTASLIPRRSLKFIDRELEGQDNSQGLGRASLNATVNTHGPNTNTHTRSNTSSIFQQIHRLMFSSFINQQRMHGKGDAGKESCTNSKNPNRPGATCVNKYLSS